MPHPTDSLKDRTSAETVSRSDAWDALFAAEFPDFFLGEQAVAELGRNVFGEFLIGDRSALDTGISEVDPDPDGALDGAGRSVCTNDGATQKSSVIGEAEIEPRLRVLVVFLPPRVPLARRLLGRLRGCALVCSGPPYHPAVDDATLWLVCQCGA